MGTEQPRVKKTFKKMLTPTSLRLLSGTDHQFKMISEIISVPQEPFDLTLWLHSDKAIQKLNFSKLVDKLSIQKKSILFDIILNSLGIEDPNSKLVELIETDALRFAPSVSKEKQDEISQALIDQYNRNVKRKELSQEVENSDVENLASGLEVEE